MMVHLSLLDMNDLSTSAHDASLLHHQHNIQVRATIM